LVTGGEVTPVTTFLDTDFKVRSGTKYLRFDLSNIQSGGDWMIKVGGLPNAVVTPAQGYYGLVRESNIYENLDFASGNSARIRNSAALFGYNNTLVDNTSTVFGYIFGNHNKIEATTPITNIIVGHSNTVKINDSLGNILIGRGLITRNEGKIETHIGYNNSAQVTNSCYIHGIKNNIDDAATYGVSVDITNHQLKAYDRYKFNNGPITIENETLSGVDVASIKTKLAAPFSIEDETLTKQELQTIKWTNKIMPKFNFSYLYNNFTMGQTDRRYAIVDATSGGFVVYYDSGTIGPKINAGVGFRFAVDVRQIPAELQNNLYVSFKIASTTNGGDIYSKYRGLVTKSVYSGTPNPDYKPFSFTLYHDSQWTTPAQGTYIIFSYHFGENTFTTPAEIVLTNTSG